MSTAIPFTLCPHSTPPTPRPRSPPPNTSSHSRSCSTFSYPHRCLACIITHHTNAQTLILDTYNGLIDDQRGRLLIAAHRKDTPAETLYDDEMVQIAHQRIEDWIQRRDEEVRGVWRGFEDCWDGGVRYEVGRSGLWIAVLGGGVRVRLGRGRDGEMVVLGGNGEVVRR